MLSRFLLLTASVNDQSIYKKSGTCAEVPPYFRDAASRNNRVRLGDLTNSYNRFTSSDQMPMDILKGLLIGA